MKKPYIFNHVIIYLLSNCNLKCVFCSSRKFEQGIMPKEKIIKIIDELKDSKAKYLILTGGEATLHKDLLEIIGYIKKRLGCKIVLNTNGTNLNSVMITGLIENGLDILKISLHSFDQNVYDKITGVSGSYKRFLKNIKAVNRIKKETNSQLKIKTNTVVLNCNYKKIDKLIDFGFQNSIKDMQFSLVDVKDYQNNKNIFLKKDQLYELYFKIYPKLLKKAINKGMKVEFRPMFMDLVNEPLNELIKELHLLPKFNEEIDNYSKGLFGKKFYANYKCYESSNGIVVMPGGNVLFCCSNYNNKIGNIFTDGLEKIMFLKKKAQPKGCNRCRLFFSDNKDYQFNKNCD